VDLSGVLFIFAAGGVVVAKVSKCDDDSGRVGLIRNALRLKCGGFFLEVRSA
jgi:hypothetical protein